MSPHITSIEQLHNQQDQKGHGGVTVVPAGAAKQQAAGITAESVLP